jgi:ArsR family transcriptional regulator
MDYVRVSEILKVMAHPARLKILRGLMKNECDVGGIVRKMNLPQSTVSQHLSLMRGRGLIAPRKEGVRTCYTVDNRKVKKIIKMLE